MSSNPNIVGDNTVIFGSNGVYGTGQIVEDGNKRLTGDKLEIQDNDGNVVTVIYFNDKNECSFLMVVKTAAPSLARGDAITIGGVADCLVDDTEEIWRRGDVRKFRVNATRYAALVVAGD